MIGLKGQLCTIEGVSGTKDGGLPNYIDYEGADDDVNESMHGFLTV